MGEHPIQGLMTTAMENLKDMIEVNTIIGEPVESQDGTTIIPVSKVGFGFAAGGSEFNSDKSSSNNSSNDDEDSNSDSLPFGGGSGGGVSITPVAFLVLNKEGVKMIHLDESTHIYEKMLDYAPQAVEKVQQIIKDLKEDYNGNKRSKHFSKEHKKENDGHTNYSI